MMEDRLMINVLKYMLPVFVLFMINSLNCYAQNDFETFTPDEAYLMQYDKSYVNQQEIKQEEKIMNSQSYNDDHTYDSFTSDSDYEEDDDDGSTTD